MTLQPQALRSPSRADAPARSSRKLRLRNIVKEYHTAVGVRRVVDNISFEIAAGEKIVKLAMQGVISEFRQFAAA